MRETPGSVYGKGSGMPADQGGCVLVMHAGMPMYSTTGVKTSHITRYRPIAPKPVAKADGGSSDQVETTQTQGSMSSISADNSTTKSSTEYRSGGGGKRSRKRATDAASQSPMLYRKGRGGAKRLPGFKDHQQQQQQQQQLLQQQGNCKLTPIISDRVATEFGPGGLQRFKDSCEQSSLQNNGVSVSLSLSGKSPESRNALTSTMHSTLRCQVGDGSIRDIERDKGFMDRAAASAPSLFNGNVSLKRESYFGTYSSSFGAESEVCSGFLDRIPSMFCAEPSKRESLFGCPSGSTSFGTESEVCSVEEAADSRKTDIITLSLLPDTPSFVNTRQNSSTTTTTTATTPLHRSDIRWGSEKQTATPSKDLNTSLTMSSRGRWSDEEAILLGGGERGHCVPGTSSSQADAEEQVVDEHYLEQRHGGSSEAVMLTDELERVLWVNLAFKRLNNERMSSRMQAIGPHIHPLGIRTHLATLVYQPPFPAFKCKAFLWGFLKKFIMQEGGGSPHHKGSNLSEVVQTKALVVSSPSPPPAPAPAKVIAPQPVRPVGSTITVQSIVTLDPHAMPVTDKFASVQESLDKGDMPSVVTDLKYRVRWVNTAYKSLVGQPKCSWLASTVGVEDVSLRLAGDVSLVCDGSQLPCDIAAFSCRVGIEWNHQGDHSVMSLPCEVIRLDDTTAGSLYVWGLDV